MVKIRFDPLPYWENWNAVAQHIGGPARGGGHPWHCVYWYFGWDTPALGASALWTCQTEYEAYQIAKDLVALPPLLRHMCWACWDNDYFYQATQGTPCWNIFRGQQRERCVPAVIWDYYSPDPPPGFQWDGS